MHSRCIRYVHQPSGAGPYFSIHWLAAPRGAAGIYVSLCFGPMSYLIITGNAPFGQSHLCHPFICGSPVFPLLSRTIITKCISSCKVNSSTSTCTVLNLGIYVDVYSPRHSARPFHQIRSSIACLHPPHPPITLAPAASPPPARATSFAPSPVPSPLLLSSSPAPLSAAPA
jgi:hypothetical protein